MRYLEQYDFWDFIWGFVIIMVILTGAYTAVSTVIWYHAHPCIKSHQEQGIDEDDGPYTYDVCDQRKGL